MLTLALTQRNTYPPMMVKRMIGYDSLTQTAIVHFCIDGFTLGNYIDSESSLDANTKSILKTLSNIMAFIVNIDGLMILSDINTMSTTMAQYVQRVAKSTIRESFNYYLSKINYNC